MPLDASPESISDFIGQPFLSALVVARDRSAEDLSSWRRTQPEEIASSTSRGLANRIHDRFIHHMVTSLDGVEDVEFVGDDTTRQFVIRDVVVVRCKRHDSSDKIRAYPTRAAIDHWGGAATLDGLGVINLAGGYRWDKELREVGPAVLTLRQGIRARPLWTVELGRDHSGELPVRIIPPTIPGLPSIDLFGIGQETVGGDPR